MESIYYPDKAKVLQSMKDDDPILLLISFDGKRALLSNIDDAMEHIILLKKLGFKETDIDSYFRVIVNKSGADWTFVCPSGYKNIPNKKHRIETYYSDGIGIIGKALEEIGYNVEITVPKRYRRHVDLMSNGDTL